MLFNSALFLFVFFPVTIIGYFACGYISPRFAAAWLAVASLVFYGFWNPPFVFLLIGSIALNYLYAGMIRISADRSRLQVAILTCAIASNLLILTYFKYLFPFLSWLTSWGVDFLNGHDSVILPLGISFFTFTQIGYLVDTKAGNVERHSWLEYVLFVTFFPHLIAGPILHHREIMPQFGRSETYRPNSININAGLLLFAIGLSKKALIADHLAPLANAIFDEPLATPMSLAWLGTLAYSLQLYFDFSGYSDMAIGLARMFGIRFPLNFNSPYKADCIIDFWQRWHMTLTRYLTSYLYNPALLFISRRRLARGFAVSRNAIKTPSGFLMMLVVPMFYTMGLAGIWHGAGWQFLIFGFLHGFYLVLNHAWRTFVSAASPVKSPVPRSNRCLSILITYSAVLVAQIFFRSNSVGGALEILYGIAGLNGIQPDGELLNSISSHGIMTWTGLVGSCLIIVWGFPNSNQLMSRYENLNFPSLFQGAIYASAFFLAAYCASGPTVQFLYFQF